MISTDMITRSVHQGVKTIVKAEVFYHASGKMVSHFNYPVSYTVLNNAQGEISIYDPENNSVQTMQNDIFTSTTSNFHYFVHNKTNDMGLGDLGFKLIETKFEDHLKITKWVPKITMNQKLTSIELVHDNFKPIYIGYRDINYQVIKKI
ncbi:hypothetical protein JYT36_00965, partial [Bacteroidales bacterium AH-315-N07]|nr:hypothetical protein [Bacteroidales bacterium AH-315-N07]